MMLEIITKVLAFDMFRRVMEKFHFIRFLERKERMWLKTNLLLPLYIIFQFPNVGGYAFINRELCEKLQFQLPRLFLPV